MFAPNALLLGLAVLLVVLPTAPSSFITFAVAVRLGAGENPRETGRARAGGPKFEVGQQVEARWKSGVDWYDGEIVGCSEKRSGAGHEYEIHYSDGDVGWYTNCSGGARFANSDSYSQIPPWQTMFLLRAKLC